MLRAILSRHQEIYFPISFSWSTICEVVGLQAWPFCKTLSLHETLFVHHDAAFAGKAASFSLSGKPFLIACRI